MRKTIKELKVIAPQDASQIVGGYPGCCNAPP